ncbi:hypothetical protein [Acidocella sp. KAb 2-4]|uniref:hypothetical protein n=1 Tax=Acidocella sp. KAb 2-4 TaxID=2885158 RepID=UPI001D08F562|nr:hypothetical protein [Acidocella sp. KAb 2-4]MCB5944564.1 hypothetical protein [Acidocella sp. KAb 2-4]
MRTPSSAILRGTALLSLGLTALLVTGCANHAPKTAYAPPPAPSGHLYPVAVDVPPPVSPKIRFTASQSEQVQQAFNVIGLKSALMVAALTCGEQDQYDAFMHSFQPHVLAAQHTMDSYFHKASGRYSGQKMEDEFVTQLANNQTMAGMAQGSAFCLNNQAEFKAVLALRSSDDLDHFVTNQPPAQAAQVASNAPVQ